MWESSHFYIVFRGVNLTQNRKMNFFLSIRYAFLKRFYIFVRCYLSQKTEEIMNVRI